MPADNAEGIADRSGGVLPPQTCWPNVMATRHAAAAGHCLATHAAFEVLEAGGNAVDAGVAAGLALGVLESAQVSVAGVAPMMIYLADSREVITISGLGTWPKAASGAYFQDKHGGAIPKGVERTVVPAAPDAWITALERGTAPCASAMSPPPTCAAWPMPLAGEPERAPWIIRMLPG